MAKAKLKWAKLAGLWIATTLFGPVAVALAQQLPLDPTQFSIPTILVDPGVANSIIKAAGLAADHRPYQPATPLGTSLGLNFGIEATMVKIPEDFYTALSQAGSTGTQIPVFPIARLHLHKGLGKRVDVGASYITGAWIKYPQIKLYGGDVKIVIAQPEEGPTWALRLCYSKSTLYIVKTTTWTPQLLISKSLDFADPYAGIGYQMTSGEISFSYPVTRTIAGQTLSASIPIQGNGSANAMMAFFGIQFKADIIGLMLALEGAYNSGGAHTLGMNFGFAF